MKKKSLLIGLAALLFPNGMNAQYTIYPIPQEQVAVDGTVSFTETVTVVCEKGVDQITRNRAAQVLKEHGLKVEFADQASQANSNLFIGINNSKGVADALAEELKISKAVFSKSDKFDKHTLSLTDAGEGRARVVILGEHTDAAFYGLASLEQMLDKGYQKVPCVNIFDYADQKSRGIVEGYYGYPYSISVKKDLMNYMMRYKMNTYLYGAKSDPYHSQMWKDPYPMTITEQQKKNGWLSQSMLKEITEVSHRTKVNFIWAIHPGNDFVNRASTVDDIMKKYEKMYALGVRQFAVFVDDVSVPSSDADLKANADHLTALQRAIEKKWNQEGAAATDTVKPLHFVPQIYCTSFKPSWGVHNKFFNELGRTPSYITIYTTGGGVWSVPNSYDFQVPKDQLHRPLAWWWNYPCNDNADAQIYPMDMYSNFYDMPAVNNDARLPEVLEHGLGIVSNPMQQGEVAKTPLFSVADYAWNTSGFDNTTSWEASFKAVLPDNEAAQKAYKFLAHYLRYNDPNELADQIAAYKQSKDPAELSAHMDKIVKACEVMIALKDSKNESDRLLYKDLSPWLLKLNTMASATKGFLDMSKSDNKDDSQWTAYLTELKKSTSLDTADEFKAYALEGMGNGISTSVRTSRPSHRTLLPFVYYMQDHAIEGYIEQNETPKRPMFISNVEGLKGTVGGSTSLYVTQGTACTLKKGDWMGIQMPYPIQMGRIEIADTLLANHTVVASADGKLWDKISTSPYVSKDYIRYVGVVNEQENPVSIKFNQKSFKLYVPTIPKVREATVPEGEIWQEHNKELIYDGDYNTFVCVKANQKNGDAYTLKLNRKQAVYSVRIAMGTTNNDYMNEGRVQVSVDGKKWKDLKVKGTRTTAFTMSLPQVKPYSNDVKLCDFDGEGSDAVYVRLYVNKANTSKWLRLYEIEVNGESSFTHYNCYDTDNNPIMEVSDANPVTSSANAQKVGNKGELTYYFQNYNLLEGVTIYCDPATLKNAKLAYSRDLESWMDENCQTETGVLHLNFPEDAQDAAAIRFSWNGDTTPAIYEIVEKANASKLPVVTEIENLSTNFGSDELVEVKNVNGQIVAKSSVGINLVEVYNYEGRLLMKQTLSGSNSVVLPRLSTQGQPVVLKVTLKDGSNQSYRLM